MGPVPFKRLVAASTEDPVFCAKSLLQPANGRKWLCSTNERCRRAEVELELSKRTKIAEIEIGNCGSAFIEVLVGSSSSEGSCAELVTLLPQSTLMSVSDCKAGRNKTKTLRYGKEHFSAAAAGEKWNRIKVICRQPFNLSEQFGLSHVLVYTQSAATAGDGSSRCAQASSPGRAVLAEFCNGTAGLRGEDTTPSSPAESCGSEVGDRMKIPRLPTGNYGVGKLPLPKSPAVPSRSPKQGNPDRESSPLHEFIGVEGQSRLLHNALRGSPHNGSQEKETNPILQKIIAEREKLQSCSTVSPTWSSYGAKKLLQKELPKVEAKTGFALSYQSDKKEGLSGVLRKMSAYDEDYEIGDEPEFIRGWRGHSTCSKRKRARKKSTSNGPSQWLCKRLNSDIITSVTVASTNETTSISDVKDRFQDATEITQLPDLIGLPPLHNTVEIPSHVGSDGDGCGNSGDATEEWSPCPICEVRLPQDVLIAHASSCGLTPDHS